MPYIRGDSLAALRYVFKVLGYPWIDQNTQASSDEWPVVAHWNEAQKNGYYWVWTGRYVRHLGRRVEERRRLTRPWNISGHTLEANLMLREKQYGGRRIRRIEAHWRTSVRLRGKVMQEVKGARAFTRPLIWQRMAQIEQQTGAHVVFSTLTDIPGWKSRVTQGLAVGAPMAVLARGMSTLDRQWCRQRGVAIW